MTQYFWLKEARIFLEYIIGSSYCNGDGHDRTPDNLGTNNYGRDFTEHAVPYTGSLVSGTPSVGFLEVLAKN